MTHPVEQYAHDVTDGRIVAGRYVRLACQRFLNDLQRQGDESFSFIFDENKADKIVHWFTWCNHLEGNLAGKPIELDPWEVFIMGNLFGWVHRETGLRRFRKAFVLVARKNGKSTLLSGLALYMLWADKEAGAQIYCTATKKEQARIIYLFAKGMAVKSPNIRSRLKIRDYEIRHDPLVSSDHSAVLKALSKDSKTQDGLNPHLGIIDEYHAHTDSSMYDVLISGMGQRSQPLLFVISTAGFNVQSACHAEYEYCVRILEGSAENESYFAIMYQLDEEDDVKDPDVWIKANPLVATNRVGMEYLTNQMHEAFDSGNSEKIRNFLVKNINKWIEFGRDMWLPVDKWKAAGVDKPSLLSYLRNMECIVGVDLSKRSDLTSMGFEFTLPNGFPIPGKKFAVLQHSFMPEESLQLHMQTDNIPYDIWRQDGLITLTPGAVTDYEFIESYIEDMELTHGWKIKEICYDPYNATQFANNMTKKGYLCVEIRQGVRTLSEPTKSFKDELLSDTVVHDGDALLTWAVGNAITRSDAQGNIMLDKEKSVNRIDPIASVINAHVRTILTVEDNEDSVYEERGVRGV